MNPTALKDMTGLSFGRLTVIRRDGRQNGRPAWLCECECGKTKTIDGKSLRLGCTKSCGCLGMESRRTASITHGQTRTPTYAIWVAMMYRCSNPKAIAFKHYGGRGITPCKKMAAFSGFREIMGDRPEKLSIERVNNAFGYVCGECEECFQNHWPRNVKWATRSEQANNKRNNRVIQFSGKAMSMAMWAREINLSYHTLQRRLGTGWSVERALTVPARKTVTNSSPTTP